MTAASERLAAHVLGLRWGDVPSAVQDHARACLLDSLAVGAAGRRAPYAAALAASLGAGAGPGRVLGRSVQMPAEQAAFLNAFQIHAQEFDCVHEGAVLHPLSALLGTLVGADDRYEPVDGETFGAALVAGVDVAVMLGLAASSGPKFFRPASAGVFGATAALGRLRGLSRARMMAAFGHALCFASGTMQAHVEGTPGLALQVGAAARSAVLAVELAQAGVPGSAGAVDGAFGYLNLFEDRHDLAPCLASLGHVFRIGELSLKPFPTGRAAQGALGALRSLLDAGARVTGLRYVAPPLIARLVGRPALAGMGVNYARLCLPFLAASMILHGRVGLESFAQARLDDPAILGLAAHITVEADGNPDPAAFVPAVLHATLAGGGKERVAVKAVAGSPQCALSPAARLAKVADCLDFAGLDLPAASLASAVDGFADLADIAPVLAAATRHEG